MSDNVDSLAAYMGWVQSQRELLDSLNMGMENGEYELFFRGVPNHSYEDIPSVFRNSLHKNENVILNECISKCCHDFVNDKTTFDMLVRMQHYGVPTRLLDVTSNPLVALYFATKESSESSEDDSEIPGKVFAYFVSKEKIFYTDAPEVSLLANLARLEYFSDSPEDAMTELSGNIKRETALNKSFDDNDVLNICCVKPRMNNPRIILQKGAFLLFGQIVPEYKRFSPYIIDLDKVTMLEPLWEEINSFASEKSKYRTKENADKLRQDIHSIMPVIEDCWERFVEKLLSTSDIAEHSMFCDEFGADVLNTLVGEIKKLKEEIEHQEMLNDNILHITQSKSPEKYSEFNRIPEFINRIMIYSIMKDIVMGNGIIAKKSQTISNKREISQELESFGINEESLFPELDVLGKSLRRKYEHKEEMNNAQ